MKIFGFEIRRASSSMNYLGIPYMGVNTGNTSAMMLSTVYRCVEVVSDSVAQLPIEPFRIDANGFAPNQIQKIIRLMTFYAMNRTRI